MTPLSGRRILPPTFLTLPSSSARWVGLKEADGRSSTWKRLPLSASSSASVETLRDALDARRARVFHLCVRLAASRRARVVDPWSLEATATGWLLRGWCTRAGAGAQLRGRVNQRRARRRPTRLRSRAVCVNDAPDLDARR